MVQPTPPAPSLPKPDADAEGLALLAEFFGVPEARLLPETRLQDLGLDSLGAVELVFEIEARFGIEVPAARARELETVAAVLLGLRELRREAR